MTQEKKKDLRIQKTESALISALFELLEGKRFEDITVSDLCNRAMIRRATFYNHYEDKYQFFDECLQQRQQTFYQTRPPQNACDPLGQYADALQDIFRYFRDNQALVDEAMNHPCASGIADIFAQRFMDDMRGKAQALQAQGREPGIPPDILAAFFTGALLGVTRWWHTSRTDLSEEALIQYTQTLLATCMPTIFTKKETRDEQQPAQEQ